MSVNLTSMLIERDAIIRARREALRRMGEAEQDQKCRIHSEFFLPLNERLVTLNKALGL